MKVEYSLQGLDKTIQLLVVTNATGEHQEFIEKVLMSGSQVKMAVVFQSFRCLDGVSWFPEKFHRLLPNIWDELSRSRVRSIEFGESWAQLTAHVII